MIKIVVKGDAVSASLSGLDLFLQYPRAALQKFAQYARNQHTKAYRGRFDPRTGKPWAPLKPSTIAQKKVKRRKGKSLLSTLFVGVNQNGIIVGYRSPIATYQQLGFTVPARVIVPVRKKALYWIGARHPVRRVIQPSFTVPARPLVGFSTRDVQEFQSIMGVQASKIWNSGKVQKF